MLKKVFYTIIIAYLLVSCQRYTNRHIETNVEIRNESLKESILEYDSILRNDPKYSINISNKDYLLTVYEKQINDSVMSFSISFSLDTWPMQEEPVRVAQVDGKIVIFYPSSTYYGILSTDKKLHEKIAYQYFPEEYRLLTKGKPLEESHFIDCPSLVLTFCQGKVVKKRMDILW